MAASASTLKPTPSPQTRTPTREILKGEEANELVFGVVGNVGSGASYVADELRKLLETPGLAGGPFRVTVVKASDAILDWAKEQGKVQPPADRDRLQRVTALQDYGDEMRSGDPASVAQRLVTRIRGARADQQGQDSNSKTPIIPDGSRRAYILDSLKHPAEIHLLRRVYQHAFTLIGVVCLDEVRVDRLKDKYRDAGDHNARSLMSRDADDPQKKHGQHASDAFFDSDFFVDNTEDKKISKAIIDELGRLVDLLTNAQKIVRPKIAETAMHAAFSAAQRSTCLSRQVGAALIDAKGNVLALGTNEVPRAGGGVYGEAVDEDNENAVLDDRCAFRETAECSNTVEQNGIIDDLIEKIPELRDVANRAVLRETLRRTRIGSLIEFSRAVHAEMDAILSAGRKGISTIGTRLFVTTFPCHYCARHIVAAGVDEVQFIEPYPKSRATHLHADSITTSTREWQAPSLGPKPRRANKSALPVYSDFPQVLFRAFTGVAPRLYSRVFTKDRDLKNSQTGKMEIGEPLWGTEWATKRVGYAQIEAILIPEDPEQANNG